MMSVIFPLIVGSLRFLLLEYVDYQEHPSEWGIHWNFYTTVAAINIMQAFVTDTSKCILYALIMMLGYQMVIT